jgi:hypothetical protein
MENKALDTLLDSGVSGKIDVGIFGFKVPFRFKIKPLYLGTILHLSRQHSRLKQVDESREILWDMFEKADNVKVFARCAAIGILNNPVRIRLFARPLTHIILSNTTVKEIHALLTIVASQMNARDFFFTSALIKGFRIVDRRPPESTSPNEPSGEPSEKSAKS